MLFSFPNDETRNSTPEARLLIDQPLYVIASYRKFLLNQSEYNVYSQHLYVKVETIPSFGSTFNTLTENRRQFNLNPPRQRLTSRSARLVHHIIRRSNLHAHSLNNSLVQIHAKIRVVVFHTYEFYVCVCI